MHVIMGFMGSIWNMPWYWRTWISLLMLVNGIMPFWFLETIEAQVVLTVFMVAAMAQMFIFHHKGFVRLLGIGHFVWIPMLLWLYMQVQEDLASDAILNWLMALFLLNGLSLLIDVVDVIRYWRGERMPVD